MSKFKVDYKVKKIVINDFSKTNLGSKVPSANVETGKIYNFKHSDGVLELGMGVRKFTTYAENDLSSSHYSLKTDTLNAGNFNKVMYFKQYFPSSGDTTHRLLIHASDGKLYLYQMFSNLNTPNWMYELQFDDIPAVLDYKKDGLDSILISSTDKLIVWSTGKTPYEITNVPTITSMCVYNDELFCTIAGENDKIWYTSNLDPESVGTESAETKYLIMEGSAGGGRKIVMLKENMYVFCDYGIGRINTYAKNEPTYNQIYLTDSQICPDTVVVCGDFVVFLARDGLYKFNGTSVDKIDVLKNQLVNSFNDYAVATHLKDSYYLALRLEFDDILVVGCETGNNVGWKNNAIIKLNLNDYSFEILRGVDVKYMLSLKAGVEEKVVLTFNTFNSDIIGEIYDGGLFFNNLYDRMFATNYIVPENMDTVTIRRIIIDAGQYMAIRVITENGTSQFVLKKSGINEIETIIQCNKFKIEIEGSLPSDYVKSIQIEYITQDK